MDTDATVYLGFWTNWTRGQALGSTLTLSSRSGLYLVAFLALFVRWTGNHFWRMLCFAVFRLRIKARARDGLYYEQQAMLRNSGSDSNALFQTFEMGSYWRKKARSPILRSMYLALFAGFHLAAFAAAGIFSAKVTSTTSEVLLRAGQCGTLDDTQSLNEDANDDEYAEYVAPLAYEDQDTVISSNYISSCFQNSSYTPVNCNSYVRSKPRWNMTVDAACPFAESMCRNGVTVHFDSGLIDSALDLGINAPTSDRVTLRKSVSCSPIRGDTFNETLNPKGNDPDLATVIGNSSSWPVAFYYGPGKSPTRNATMLFNPAMLLEQSSSGLTSPYALMPQVARTNGEMGTDSFTPIQELRQPQADVTLLLLAQVAVYSGTVTDPWFGGEYGETSDESLENADINPLISILGCTESQQFCNPQNPSGPVCAVVQGGSNTIDKVKDELALNMKQGVTVDRISKAMNNTDLFVVSIVLGAPGLLASRSVLGIFSPPLPPDQWILEVQNWFAIGLANLQLRISRFVTGYGSGQKDLAIIPPTADERWMCDNQIVQRNDYASFSVLGLFMLLGIGLAIISINLLLITVVHRMQPSTALNHLRRVEWDKSETLELQRQLFAAKGIDIERLSANRSSSTHGLGIQSPYATKSEGSDLALSPSNAKQASVDYEAQVNASRNSDVYAAIGQMDDATSHASVGGNVSEEHEMSRFLPFR